MDLPKIFLRRKKMALMLSYCGQGYFGMQRNSGFKTIEDELQKALLAAEYIDLESLQKPTVMHFQRAARTDKSVSAARQIVSMKMPDGIEVDKINEFLPPEIRVMGAKKVTKNFCCKGNCDARTYLYMLPTFAFAPLEENVREDYRITKEVLESLRETLKLYLGTKNFHNFTSKKKPTDPSSKRYIMSFTASDPFEKDGLEYLILRVKGQSFMLHQIRKMIGLIVAFMRGFAGKDTFTKSWSHQRIDIPKAPGIGLVLDHVHYDRYNQRYGGDGMHEKLTWEEVEDKVEEFCQGFIYPIITKCENEEKSMFEWLRTLPFHTYDVREAKDSLQVQKQGADTEGAEAALAIDVDGVKKPPGGFSGIGNAALHLVKTTMGKDFKLDEDSEEEGDDDEQVPRKRARATGEISTRL